MLTLVKSTLKLLFRNPGFWFFLLFAPVVSVLILGLNIQYSSTDASTEMNELMEVEEDEKLAYYSSSHFAVKVYDASGSEASEFLLNDLTNVGMYKICRVKCSDMTYEDYQERIKTDAYNDRMGAAVYIPSDFDEQIKNKDTKEALKISILSDDERADLFITDIKLELSQMTNVSDINELKDVRNNSLKGTVRKVAEKGEKVLTNEQESNKMQLGYSFAMLTMSFVFCGVFIAHTAINEQKNRVLTRIMLTGNKYGMYFVSKFIVMVIVSALITGLTAIGIMFLDSDKLGMGRGKLILLIFLLGVVFGAISLLIGILSGDIMTSNFVVFTIWAFSSLLSGMYFPLDNTTTVIKAVQYIMPQKWFMYGAEMFYFKDKKVYLVLLCITVAYMLVTLSVGSVGLKLKKQNE